MKKTIQSIKVPSKKSTKRVELKKIGTTLSTLTKKNVSANKAVITNFPVSIVKNHYQAIDRNIYYDGYSYRTRVTINGKVNSRNFSNVRAAKKFRTEIRKTR